jgi:hypothetical protein
MTDADINRIQFFVFCSNCRLKVAIICNLFRQKQQNNLDILEKNGNEK